MLRDNPQGLSPERVAQWLGQLAGALDYLHQRGVIHRDLKPGNLLLEDERIKLGDFGLAKQIWPNPDAPHSECVGTVHYMAPEVARGQYGPASDVYSLAVLAYELLTGQVPFPGETPAEVLMKHLTETPRLEHVSTALQPLFGRALAKDPVLRPTTAGQFAHEFQRLVATTDDPHVNSWTVRPVVMPGVSVVRPTPKAGLKPDRRSPNRSDRGRGLQFWDEVWRNPAIPICLLVTAVFLIPLLWSHTARVTPLVIWGIVAALGFWLQSRLRRLVRRTQRPGAALRLVK